MSNLLSCYFGSFHLLARAKACVNDYRAALQNEKSAYSVYKTKVSASHAIL